MPTPSTRYQDQVAVITGGGSGIGRATALLLAGRGATVHVVDIRTESAAAVAAEIIAAGGRAVPHTVDVSDPAAVLALADAVYRASGRCDVLFNNAGVGHCGPVEQTPLEDWQRVIGVNLMGVVHGVHAFVPRMLTQPGGAAIVNTASMLGLFPWPTFTPYTASKHAVVGLTEALHAELAPRGIRVGAVCPGMTATPIAGDALMRGDLAQVRSSATSMMSRFGTSPHTVAKAVADLIDHDRLLRVTPRWQVAPLWLVQRISPRAGTAFAGLAQRLMVALSRRIGAAAPPAETELAQPGRPDHAAGSPTNTSRTRQRESSNVNPSG
jgi:NAD(P)-dependent dehydrogenase (short-subunit alcohol dehydrogenase family)